MRDLTPDMPDLLGDFLISIYKETHHFFRFWSWVAENVSLDERVKLLEWYCKTAFELMGRRLEIQKWLVKSVCVGVAVGVVFDVGAPCIAAGIFGLKMDQKEKLSEPQASFFLSHF